MQKINGIGGVFIVAQDPEMLGEWYQKYLGVPLPPASYEEPEWVPRQGPTVFAFMSADSEHFNGKGKTWALTILQRYSPRRAKSPWSLINAKRAEELIAEGRMQPAGLAQINAAKREGRWPLPLKGESLSGFVTTPARIKE